jgi:hypothetical protein
MANKMNKSLLANKMSKSLKDKLTAVIGPLLRSERPGGGTQRPEGVPMKNKSITLAVEEPYAAVVGGEAGTAPLEAVGRALGYSEKELVLAADVLNRFAWRRPAEPSRKDANATEAGRNRAA